MITHIPYTGSCCSWHNIGILGQELKICKKKVECPLFFTVEILPLGLSCFQTQSAFAEAAV
jgi:hypothetical protein